MYSKHLKKNILVYQIYKSNFSGQLESGPCGFKMDFQGSVRDTELTGSQNLAFEFEKTQPIR